MLQEEIMGNQTVKKRSAIVSYGIYLLTSYFITVVCLIVLSFIVFQTKMDEKYIDIINIAIYIISTFFAGYLASKAKKQHKIVWGLLVGLGYFLVLCIISVILNHTISPLSGNFITTLMICGLGGMAGTLVK